jgi:hypothetical protein
VHARVSGADRSGPPGRGTEGAGVRAGVRWAWWVEWFRERGGWADLCFSFSSEFNSVVGLHQLGSGSPELETSCWPIP